MSIFNMLFLWLQMKKNLHTLCSYSHLTLIWHLLYLSYSKTNPWFFRRLLWEEAQPGTVFCPHYRSLEAYLWLYNINFYARFNLFILLHLLLNSFTHNNNSEVLLFFRSVSPILRIICFSEFLEFIILSKLMGTL